MGYELSFSVNLHDEDGDIYEEGILVHLGNGVILTFKNMDEYNNFIDSMESMRGEIYDNL